MLADFIAALDTAEAKRSDVQKTLLAEKFRKNDVERVNLDGQLAELNAKLKQLKAKITTTLVVKEMAKPRESYIHVRGDFLRKGAAVEGGMLAVLPPPKLADGAHATRLDLARWLFDPRESAHAAGHDQPHLAAIFRRRARGHRKRLRHTRARPDASGTT